MLGDAAAELALSSFLFSHFVLKCCCRLVCARKVCDESHGGNLGGLGLQLLITMFIRHLVLIGVWNLDPGQFVQAVIKTTQTAFTSSQNCPGSLDTINTIFIKTDSTYNPSVQCTPSGLPCC